MTGFVRFKTVTICLALLAGTAMASAQTAPPPPTPTPFAEALRKAADDLFTKAAVSGDKIELVIDPLIDAASGAQSTATRSMQATLMELVRTHYPRFTVLPFDSESLAGKPVVLVGTFTAVNNQGVADGPRDAYRICLTLADLKSNSVVSKGVTRARTEGVDTTPTPYYRDSPLWAKDQATDAYIKTCQGTKLGDPIDPGYVEKLTANALINDGILAYETHHFREALAFYRAARKLPGGEQHRVRIGTYLAASKLARREDMVDAFGDLIDYGLGTDRLMVKLLVKPGTTQVPVLDGLIAMAKDLDCEIVAEGVETEEQALYLRSRGVIQAQGFIFAPALKIGAFRELATALHATVTPRSRIESIVASAA